MKKVFIEARSFTDALGRFLDENAYATLQNQLMADPDQGAVIPGAGGLRKMRVRDPRHRRGKRGGIRLIYLHVPEADWIYLAKIYAKGEKDDLNMAEKKTLRKLAEAFKQQAIRSITGATNE